jgi:carbamoyl-phosphate synthase large subunit
MPCYLAFNFTPLIVTRYGTLCQKNSKALKIKGLINIQFAIKDDKVYVIEANPRASRTTPFIAKAYGVPYLNYATKVMLDQMKVADIPEEKHLDWICH